MKKIIVAFVLFSLLGLFGCGPQETGYGKDQLQANNIFHENEARLNPYTGFYVGYAMSVATENVPSRQQFIVLNLTDNQKLATNVARQQDDNSASLSGKFQYCEDKFSLCEKDPRNQALFNSPTKLYYSVPDLSKPVLTLQTSPPPASCNEQTSNCATITLVVRFADAAHTILTGVLKTGDQPDMPIRLTKIQ